MCPPCTRATPLTGVGSLLVGGWGSGALHHKNCSVEVKIMQYPCDLAPLPAGHRIPVGGWVWCREHTPLPAGHRIPVGGWVCCRERSRTPPTHQQGTESLLAGGFTVGSAIARLPTPPTHQQGTHPCQGCCPCARWAHANNPAVINKLPPPSRRW